jgi:hypothetical protein
VSAKDKAAVRKYVVFGPTAVASLSYSKEVCILLCTNKLVLAVSDIHGHIVYEVTFGCVQGADYFYMVNDDMLLVTPRWADRFIHALKNSPIAPNFGVAGAPLLQLCFSSS